MEWSIASLLCQGTHQASQLAGDAANIMGKGQVIPWHNLTSELADSTTFPFSKNHMQQRLWLTTTMSV
jgi:hypothetical protein